MTNLKALYIRGFWDTGYLKGGGGLLLYEIFRASKTGYRVQNSLIFAFGIHYGTQDI